MGLRWVFLALSLGAVFGVIWSSSIEGCPKACFCSTMSKIVYCSRRGLAVVPDVLPVGTLQLNLNANSFRSRALQRSNFSRHLTLEHLYLSDCGIEVIEVDTFADLVNLKWLDMSDNKIRVIQENTFRGLRLQHLFLNGNKEIRLLSSSFEGLATTGLYLHDCGLTSIAPDVLVPLNGTLGNLWLNGNQLERVDQLLQNIFSSLTHIRLASNPLRCNCEMVWLKELYDTNGDVFRGAEAPGCHAPVRLKGKHFGELSLFDFRCQSPAFSNIDAFFGGSSGQLKCVATGDPTPSLYWIQPSGKAIKFDPPAKEEVNRNEGILILESSSNPASSESSTATGTGLSGMYICIANNEAGNATLTINVTWPPRSLRPEVDGPFQHQHHQHHHQQHHFHHNHILLRPPPQSGATDHLTSDPHRLHPHPALSLLPPPPPSTSSSSKPLPPSTDHYILVRATSSSSSSSSDVITADRQPLFTLTELALSVVGTHFATILLAVVCLCLYHWTRKRKMEELTGGSRPDVPVSERGRVDDQQQRLENQGRRPLCGPGNGGLETAAAFASKYSVYDGQEQLKNDQLFSTQFRLMQR